MKKTIIFDRNAVNWCGNDLFNEAYIKHVIEHVQDLLKARGYVYIQEIHAYFGVEWDPHEPNDAVIYGENELEIKYSSSIEDAGYKISISY